MQSGWPSLSASRGQIMLALDGGADTVRGCLRSEASLEGLPMFVNSLSLDAPHAAHFAINDPQRQATDVVTAVRAGMLVRTRAGADTQEARQGNIARREAALASGAQYVSTD